MYSTSFFFFSINIVFSYVDPPSTIMYIVFVDFNKSSLKKTRSITSPTQTHNILHHTYAKTTIFSNARYTTHIPRDPHTVTSTAIKSNMRHIHTSIVSRYLSTRGNTKILCTLPLHIISSEDTLIRSLVVPWPNSEQINHPFSNHTYTTSTPTHIHHYYDPFITHIHSIHVISSTHPHAHQVVTPGFMDKHRQRGYWPDRPQTGRWDSPH